MEADNNKRLQATDYEHKVEQRAVKRREIGDRSNMTLCRSPTRHMADTRWIKDKLHRKRQFEFSKRRPAIHSTYPLLSSVPRHKYFRKTLHSLEHMTQTLTSIRWPLITSQNVNLQKDDVNCEWQTVSTSLKNDDNYPRLNTVRWDVSGLDSVLPKGKVRKEQVIPQDITQDVINQSGFVTVKEANVQQLADYLEEALHREEALKKKLASLQKSATTLVRSAELLWKTRCDEDLLKSKIKSLEAQLQVCIKKVPQDGVKKVVLKMEKQREEYEQKSLKAIQRAQNEKVEAQIKTEHLQGVLQTTQAESEYWQRIYEELKEGSNQLKQRQAECTDHILQLQHLLERSVGQNEMLREQTESLQQETTKLQSCMAKLEEENLALREHLQEITGHSREYWNNNTHTGEEVSVLDQILQTDNSMNKQLKDMELRLRIKEKECMELQAELEAMELECYAYQSRLTQCREEINSLTTRQNSTRKRCCGSWFCICFFLLLMVVVVVVAALWLYHPPGREQLHQFYSHFKRHMEDYIIRAASTQNGACMRPV